MGVESGLLVDRGLLDGAGAAAAALVEGGERLLQALQLKLNHW